MNGVYGVEIVQSEEVIVRIGLLQNDAGTLSYVVKLPINNTGEGRKHMQIVRIMLNGLLD